MPDLLNNKKALTAVSVAVVVAGVVVYLLCGSSAEAGSGKRFFTVDDGKTFLAADAKLIPPCVIDGKTAVFASVFRCPTCGKEFVGNMSRYTAAGAEALRNQEQSSKPAAIPVGPPQMRKQAGIFDMEMKRPGEPENAWRVQGPPANMAAMKAAASGVSPIHCPDHRDVAPEPVMP